MALVLVGGPARAAEPVSTIVEGSDALVCDFPTVVALVDLEVGYCTGVLIHPRVVLTAAHCVNVLDPGFVAFGESVTLPDSDNPPAFVEVEVEGCAMHPDYMPDSGALWDLGYCTLAEDAPEVPIVPPLAGCEAEILMPDQELTVVGFGRSDRDDPTLGRGIKGYTTQAIQPFDWSENDIVTHGDGPNTPCYGDSGGPAFVQLPDGSWRVAGVESTLHPTFPQDCFFGAVYEGVPALVEWVENDSGFDITPCHDADGTWNPTEACQAFPTQLLAAEGSTWERGCSTPDLSDLSMTCGAPWDPPEPPDPEPPDPESGTTSDSLDGTSDDSTGALEAESTGDIDVGGTAGGEPAEEDGGDGGCGCRSSGGRGEPRGMLLLLLGSLLVRRRGSRA